MRGLSRRELHAYYYYSSGYYWWAWIILGVGLLIIGFLLLFLWGRQRKRRQMQLEMQQQQAAAAAAAATGAPGGQYYANTAGQQPGYGNTTAGEYTYSPDGGYSYQTYSEYPESGANNGVGQGVVYGYPVDSNGMATGSTAPSNIQK